MAKVIIELPDDSHYLEVQIYRVNSSTGEKLDHRTVLCSVVSGDLLTIKPFSDASIQR